jgi:hypothetical protein
MEHENPQFPDSPGNARFHRRSDPEGTMDAHEVVPGEVQAERSPKVFPFLTEAVREVLGHHPLGLHGARPASVTLPNADAHQSVLGNGLR